MRNTESQPRAAAADEPGAVLVTGASSGIGRACALRLQAAGYRVFAGVRDPAAGERLVSDSPGLRCLRLDVTDPASISEAGAALEAGLGGTRLYGLVNNAGIAVAGPLEFVPPDDLRAQLDVNVVGQLAVTQRFLPLLREAHGRIIFMSSVSGRVALPMTGAYAASKYALEALADALRLELWSSGVKVVLVEPGMVATPIWETSRARADRLAETFPARAFDLYGPLVEAARRRAAAAPREGLAPEVVAQVVERALEAAHPRARYVVGVARRRLLLRMLPTSWRDRLVARKLARL